MVNTKKILSFLALSILSYTSCFSTCNNKSSAPNSVETTIPESPRLFTYLENCYKPDNGFPTEVLQCKVNVKFDLFESETIDRIVLNLPDIKGKFTVHYDLTKGKRVDCMNDLSHDERYKTEH